MSLARTDYPNIDERLYSTVLENGLRVLVVPRPGFLKKYAFFAANYGGAARAFRLDGRRVETPEGVAHFLEHKLFDMPWGSALSALSAAGAQPNAYTSDFITAYHFECTEGFAENLGTLLEFVSTPYFTAESVAKERGIIGEEIGMAENEPNHALYYGLMRSLYERSPVRSSVVGTAESIARITPEVLTDCHRAFYAPSNMLLAVVGDVEPESVAEAARRALPAERAPVPEPDYGEIEPLSPFERRFSREMDVSAPQFMIGAKLPPGGGGDALLRKQLAAALALRALAGSSSPLYTSMYSEGLVRSLWNEADWGPCAAYAVIGGESREPERVLERFCEAASAVAREGFEPAAFERCRLRALPPRGVRHAPARPGLRPRPGGHAGARLLCRLRRPARLRPAAGAGHGGLRRLREGIPQARAAGARRHTASASKGLNRHANHA